MTVEMVLLLAVWGYILLGVFFGDLGPIETFRKSTPRLAARIEKNLSTGREFKDGRDSQYINWKPPER